ncbi:MBL fold metallo-hydrolase [Providencia rustigianii]|uniref:MBL fold metallo-hydrolase n=1 Tax=Providencia rustigianii TaxID=158850 RepID=UPI000F6D4EB8|nr:MBL fold metallo-hydrolase [Providencia rustigianii]MTC59224.1 MBL fold metallo-hydrolase [Providencia rustigianii]VEH55704.1 Metallo-beta-lactamase superfamily [Providencia rustigianii]
MTINISVLVDNNTLIDSYFCGEPGVCYYIEADGKKILFDTGYSDVFIENANILNIDLAYITDLVLSHGHNDHTWGINHLIQYLDRRNLESQQTKKLICHPNALLPKNYKTKVIGANTPRNVLTAYFDLVETQNTYYISDNVIFLGQIPRNNAFEGKDPIGKTVDQENNCVDDYVLDDTALAITTSEGLIVITGCSHSGICNIVEYAKQVTKVDKIITVIGGFHLQHASDNLLNQTSHYFKQQNLSQIHPCHCTDLAAKIHLATYIPVKEVGSGMQLTYPA